MEKQNRFKQMNRIYQQQSFLNRQYYGNTRKQYSDTFYYWII